MQYVLASDIPADHKAVIIETLTQTLRREESARIRQDAHDREREIWQPHETARLRARLEGKIANSWLQADELSMSVAAELQRDSREVRSKAIELGLGAGVDFAIAKAMVKLRDKPSAEG